MGQLCVSLDVRGRRCLVVGGGAVARRKVDALHDAGAAVTVVSPQVDDAIAALPDVTIHTRPFASADIADVELVFACTGDPAVNARVSDSARATGVWVNVVDDPDACTFFVNAAVQRGPLTIAVGTAGASPALSRRIREELETQYGPAYEPFVTLLGRLRSEVLAGVADPERRRALFAELAALPCESVYANGGEAALERGLRQLLEPAEATE